MSDKFQFIHLSQDEILDKIINDDFNAFSIVCKDSHTTLICENIRHQMSGIFWNKLLAKLKDDKLQEESLGDFKREVKEQLSQYVDDILFLRPSNTLIYLPSSALKTTYKVSKKIFLNKDIINKIPSIILFIHEQEELRCYQNQLFSLEKDCEM